MFIWGLEFLQDAKLVMWSLSFKHMLLIGLKIDMKHKPIFGPIKNLKFKEQLFLGHLQLNEYETDLYFLQKEYFPNLLEST